MWQIVWQLMLFLVLCAGNLKLWAELVNRLHARPWRCGVLHRLRVLHDLVAVGFPGALLILLSRGWGSGPLPSPSELGLAGWIWHLYLIACLAGFCWLVWTAIEHWRSAPPAAQLSNHSETFDVAEELGRRPLGSGLHPYLARVPMNEQFQLQLNHKRFAHPRVPAEWNGLRILHISDWHFHGTVDLPYFEYASDVAARQSADLVVFTGDLFDDLKCLGWVAETLGRLTAPLGKYFILGNHDWYCQPERIRRELQQWGWTDLSSRVLTVPVRGRTLALAGDETPWMGTTPDFSPAEAADFKLLLSHTPDHFQRAQAEGVDLMLAGHNHGGQVRLPVLGPIFSPSRYGTRYASGTFFASPTLMHVSRGLSGRHPYRWKCLPEIAVIELQRNR